MINITPQQKRAVVDYAVDALLNKDPKEFGLHGLEGNWFFINNQGNVAINLRQTTYAFRLIVKSYADEHDPNLAEELKPYELEQDRLYYSVFTAAMGRKSIKDFKVQFLLNNSDQLREKQQDELTRINREIERLLARRNTLLSLLK